MGQFQMEVKFDRDFVVFYTNGYINDLGGEKIERTCEDILREGYRKVIVNFSESPIINSIGISILIGLIDRVKRAKGSVCFTNLTLNNTEVFEFMGLTQYAPVFPNEEEAVRFTMGHA